MTDDDAPRLFTGRLELVAATAALARAAATSAEALGRALECEVPSGWPPWLLKDREARWAAELATDPALAGWSAWYVVQVRPPVLVGSIGFGGRPDGGGCVELGYAMMPKFRRHGYATEAMGALIDWAFSHPEVRRIRAHTPKQDQAAIRTLEKNGLSHVGTVDDVLSFELARPA